MATLAVLRRVIVAALLLSLATASQQITAHRLLQYDRGVSLHGSRNVWFKAPASTRSDTAGVLMLRMQQLPASLPDLLNKSCSAVLVILPEKLNQLSEESKNDWRAAERVLLQQQLNMPVYFTRSSPQVEEIYAHVAAESSTTDEYQLSVNEGEASPISPVLGANLQGWLDGAGADSGAGGSLPTLAIVAHYDSIGVVPSLSHGADDNGSGVVALLELARLFSKLYKRIRTQGKYNLLFLLPGAGRINFSGTKYWLEEVDPQLLQNVEFALCLDSIGQANGLHFHVSKRPKDPETVRLFTEFKRTALEMSIPFDVTHRKIDLSDPEVYWQHEVFSRKRVLGATLSGHQHPKSSFEHATLLDVNVDMNILERNIIFVAEVVARHIYDLQGKDRVVFKDSLAFNPQFVQAWHSVLVQENSMQAYLTGDKDGDKDIESVKLIEALESVLSKYVNSVRKEVFALNSATKFYDTITVQISAFKAKPVSFDIIFSFVIVVYLFLLLVFMKGFDGAMEELAGLLRRSKGSKSRKHR